MLALLLVLIWEGSEPEPIALCCNAGCCNAEYLAYTVRLSQHNMVLILVQTISFGCCFGCHCRPAAQLLLPYVLLL